MPIRDYIVYPDHFEPQGLADIAYRVVSEFAFPCCVCVHNDKKQTQRPCNKCGHNVNQLSESNAKISGGIPYAESDCSDLSWCCTEGVAYSLESLGDDAWLTGCPLCGSSDCGRDLTPEQIKERDEFYGANA